MGKHFENPASVTDLIVPYHNGVVLIRRKNEPFKDFWALPGGFLNNGEESLEEAAVRELEEETSLRTTPCELRLVGVYSDPRRDPRGHVISHAYEVRKCSGYLMANDDAAEARVFTKLPENLAFDHRRILSDYFSGCKNGM